VGWGPGRGVDTREKGEEGKRFKKILLLFLPFPLFAFFPKL
jgi:hypothetical protein